MCIIKDMRTKAKTYLTVLGILVALLLLYTSNAQSSISPKFTYSIKSHSQSVTTQFTAKVTAEAMERLSY